MRGRWNEKLLDIAQPKTFCRRNCLKRAEAIEACLVEVTETKIWPLRSQRKQSIQAIIDSPGLVNRHYRKVEGACLACDNNLRGKEVRSVRDEILMHWEGLCLDCVNTSRTNSRDRYVVYGSSDSDKTWGTDCRLKSERRRRSHQSDLNIGKAILEIPGTSLPWASPSKWNS